MADCTIPIMKESGGTHVMKWNTYSIVFFQSSLPKLADLINTSLITTRLNKPNEQDLKPSFFYKAYN